MKIESVAVFCGSKDGEQPVYLKHAAELGKLIAAALVGTFLGILVSYGFVGPLATSMEGSVEEEGSFYQMLKFTILAAVNNNPPATSVEFGRKTVPAHIRPGFAELEEYLRNAKK